VFEEESLFRREKDLQESTKTLLKLYEFYDLKFATQRVFADLQKSIYLLLSRAQAEVMTFYEL
jgi:hypothetical protein